MTLFPQRPVPLRVVAARAALLVLALLLVSCCRAQDSYAAQAAAPAASVVMLSDLHFDPFADPAKVALLQKAPMAQWQHILQQPASPDQPARSTAVQSACKSKQSTDAPYALVRSALDAARQQGASASFVLVAGDLLVHDLDCRYRVAMQLPADSGDDQAQSAAFATQTILFVMQQVQASFPHVPVYFTLGNNDSRCNHNHFDVHDALFADTAAVALAGLHGAERAAALATWKSAGYYAATLPAPMQATRLLVLNNTFWMPGYATCKGDADDRAGEREQAAWLQRELAAAQRKHERVWLMGHLPPTLNVSASLAAANALCTSGSAVPYQRTTAFAELIQRYAGTIRLGIFGHTHLDEFHLLRGEGGVVPIKVVGAITPLDGIVPSFTVGAVDPASATLADFAVYAFRAGKPAGQQWPREYTFDREYGAPRFDGDALATLVARLQNDTAGTNAASRSLQSHLRKGSVQKKTSVPWHGTTCALDTADPLAFQRCVCSVP